MLPDQQDTVSSLYHCPLTMTNMKTHHIKTLHILIEQQTFSTAISWDRKPQGEALLTRIYLSTFADLSAYLLIHIQPFPFPKSV